MAASAGAGLAVRLMQLNINNGGGRVDQSVGLFLPMLQRNIHVPISSNITFQFEQFDVNSVRGMYDMYIFSLSLKATTPTANLSTMTYAEIFTVNDVILWPIIAVQKIQPKAWPGGGAGPSKKDCLLFSCQSGGTVWMATLMRQHYRAHYYYNGNLNALQNPSYQLEVDEKVHIKWLTLPSTTFKSYMLDWIRNLRNIHNDNVNVFAGCFLDANSFNFVYHHCSRGSLQVETIGDAYMVASGLPIPNDERHAGEIATMALDLLSHCGTFTISHLPHVPLRIRIGLHSGRWKTLPLSKNSSMFCTIAFRIHISQPLKDLLDKTGQFTTEYRGTIDLEGGLCISSYWLLNSANFHKPLPTPPPLNA
ncbi:unnamed protein product [Schistocephalus solidus]|uniref:Guanylate cyclase domain-containing protein n=1 Tax=Schistocephalus solidus TaxID=70667 RepID=A0A183SZR2_SCHSO|nr:unnamed protein product [Schistocephalus solidus]